MEIHVFGKDNCAYCVSTKSKVGHYLKKWNMVDRVPLVYHDMESVDGRADGCFYDVLDVPTTLVLDQDGEVIQRWSKVVPDSEELRQTLQELAVDSTN